MAKIKRFFECLVPVSVCNLECPYCYIIQEDRRKMALADMPYSPEHIARALRPERVGGTCFISICGAGETLAQKEVVPIVGELLKEGHFVNITTNGTLSRRFDELIEACGENIGHLHLSFSMHYTELLRKGWVETFFDNIRKMRDAGASILLQLNLCDEYVPYIEEIQRLSMEKVGAYPQVALTRDEQRKPFGIFTKGTREEYLANGEKFHSPLFDNLNVIKGQIPVNGAEARKLEEMQKANQLVIEALAFIRGRSLSETYFIVDEAQNLTPHEIKTIITRAGEGTKMVFTGDIQQIDSPYLDAQSNGLAYMVDKMKGQDLFAHINLVKGERSQLSELASNLL